MMLFHKLFIKKCAKCTIIVLLVLILSACSAGPSAGGNKVSKSGFLLDTVVSVTLFGGDEETVERCFEECARYGKIFSRTDPESELYALNHADSMEVSDELLAVIKKAVSYCEKSGGRFDITMGAVSELYGFSSDDPHVPDEASLAEEISHVGYENIVIDGSTVTRLDKNAVIDLGAIAKGYIADKLAELITENGVNSAIISLGGNVVCVGSKPGGNDFTVGIQRPFSESSEAIATVFGSDFSVVTSGVYERSFEQDGKFYHHILDPKTGLSVENGLYSVSIACKSSVDADALSTVCFVLGLEDGMALVNSLDGVDALFITDSCEIYVSEGFDNVEA